MKKTSYTSAGGVIIDHERMLLLLRPARNEVRLPKGHVEPGETVAETALRETTEETGFSDLSLVCSLGSQIVEFEVDNRHVLRTEHYFLMRLNSVRCIRRSAADEEQFRLLWAPLEDAPQLLTFAAEQDVARRAVDAYRNGCKSSA